MRFTAAAFLVVSAFAAATRPALADRLVASLPLGGSATASIDAPGGLATVGFLVTQGDGRKLQLSVTPTKKPASSLVPDVKLVAPDGSQYAFAAPGDGVSAAGAAAWKAKMPNVPQTGLWRLEIRGANATSGAFAVSVKGKDATAATFTPSVPVNGYSDVAFFAGENSSLTLTTKRTSASKTIVPRAKIFDASGNELEGLFVANAKGVLKASGYRLPVFGRYVLRFSAGDGVGGQFAATVKTGPAKLKSGAPVADARVVEPLGPDSSEERSSGEVEPGFVGVLDATHSADPSGRPLTYRWTQVSGPKVALADADTARPSFVAGGVPASLAFQLAVSAGGTTSKAATVGVEIARRPVADAGRAQIAAPGAAVTLDGGASLDRRGTGLRYEWTQIADGSPGVTLRDAATARASFDAPAAGGVLRFGLVVDDGTARSARDVVVVDVGAGGRRVAEAGRDQYAPPMATVHLCGLGSATTATTVLDGAIAWTQIAGPTVALAGADTPWPAFQAPKSAADLAFKLTIDGVEALSDVASVHVRDGETDVAPTTRGNGPIAAAPGGVGLSAASSTDPTHDALFARWAQTVGARLALAGADATAATATLPAGAAIYEFGVQVNDGLRYGAPDLVLLRNSGYAGRPIAIAGSDTKIDVPGAGVVLDGHNSLRTSGTGPLTYQWTQIDGKDWYDVAAKSPAFDATAAKPAFALPATLSSLSPTRTLTFQLVVADGTSSSYPDFVTVAFDDLPPDSGPSVTADASTTTPIAGQTVTLLGTKEDLDTPAADVTVEWIQSQNGAPTITLTPSATTLSPTFVMPDTTSPVVFKLYANDGTSRSAPATVTLTMDRKPVAAVVVSPLNGPPGTVVSFDGRSSSDFENHALTYRWTQIVPSSPSFLADPTVSSFSVTAPSGVVKFQLVVNDGRQDSIATPATFAGIVPPVVAPSASPLDVSVNGVAPFAGDLKGYAAYGATVTLAANATGAGASPTYTWRVISQAPSAMPTISLSSATDPSPTFVVPVPGNTAFGWNPRPQVTVGVVCHGAAADSLEGTMTIHFFASLNNGTASQASTPTNNTVYGIVSPNCAGCHSGTSNYCPVGSGTSSGSAAGLGMATKAAFLANMRGVASCAGSKTRVPTTGVTGAGLTNSYLYDRLMGYATPQMPQGFSSFLPAAKTNLFRDWIDQGSLDN